MYSVWMLKRSVEHSEGLIKPLEIIFFQANWKPAEDRGSHDQSRPGTNPRTASFWLRTMENRLGTGLPNLECPIRDVVNSIGAAASTRYGWVPPQLQVLINEHSTSAIGSGFPEGKFTLSYRFFVKGEIRFNTY